MYKNGENDNASQYSTTCESSPAILSTRLPSGASGERKEKKCKFVHVFSESRVVVTQHHSHGFRQRKTTHKAHAGVPACCGWPPSWWPCAAWRAAITVLKFGVATISHTGPCYINHVTSTSGAFTCRSSACLQFCESEGAEGPGPWPDSHSMTVRPSAQISPPEQCCVKRSMYLLNTSALLNYFLCSNSLQVLLNWLSSFARQAVIMPRRRLSASVGNKPARRAIGSISYWYTYLSQDSIASELSPVRYHRTNK